MRLATAPTDAREAVSICVETRSPPGPRSDLPGRPKCAVRKRAQGFTAEGVPSVVAIAVSPLVCRDAGLLGIAARATESEAMRVLFARSFPRTHIPATVRVAWRLGGKPAAMQIRSSGIKPHRGIQDAAGENSDLVYGR